MPSLTTPLHAPMDPPAEATGSELRALRQQAALVRSLLDELDALTHPGASGRLGIAIGAQTIEELAQLACKMMEAASAMASKCVAEVHLATWPESERTFPRESSNPPPVTRQH